MYGVDVAVTRADDLDRKLIQHVADKGSSSVLDLGCGAGGQSIRLSKGGVRVLGVDIQDFSKEFEVLRETNDLTVASLEFIQADVADLKRMLLSRRFDDCSVQRMLHYLPYQVAKELLADLRSRVNDRLYMSVTGLGTAIGENYQDKQKEIGDRFCGLDKEDSETFSIEEPLCLYSKEEVEDLLKLTGWNIVESWVSAFGNIKIVAK